MENTGPSQRVRLSPEDVRSKAFEIVLSRLPVFTVQQCRSVCKSWNRRICSGEFGRLWSNLNASDNSWVVLVDNIICTSSWVALIFYNVRTNDWRLKEINLRGLLPVEAGSHMLYDWYLSQTTAKGLIVFRSRHNDLNLNNSEINFLVLNPLTNAIRHISAPLAVVNIKVTSSTLVDILDFEQHHFKYEVEGRRRYKLLVASTDNAFTCYIYDFWKTSWTFVVWPPISVLFQSFHSKDTSLLVRFYDYRRVLQVVTSGWKGKRYNYGFLVGCQSHNDARNLLITGRVDLIEFVTDENSHRYFTRTLRVPWSWNLRPGHNSKNGSHTVLCLAQREDLIVAPFVDLDDINQCQAISINTLDIRHSEDSALDMSEQNWRNRAVMPNAMFESLHGRDKLACHFRVDCFHGVNCVTDDNTDQLLFLSNTSSQIVAYRFSHSSPDEEWVSMRYPTTDLNILSLRKINHILTSPTLAALQCNFQFRPDITP